MLKTFSPGSRGKAMSARPITRRTFLKIGGAVVGAAAITGVGIQQFSPAPVLPEFTSIRYGETSMSKKILVAYASQAGSTAGVADMIGKTLSEKGAQVDVRPVSQVTDLSSYDAVVLGSAIHGQKWLPEAMEFLRAHRAELARKPFASFMVCITLSMANSGQYLDGLKSWMSPVRELVRPVGEGYFSGALDFSKLPFSFNVLAMRLVVLSGMWKEGDHRNWDAIRGWAQDLSPRLIS
jgi:menaquinone-dependent protoporphyrinogen oxidase